MLVVLGFCGIGVPSSRWRCRGLGFLHHCKPTGGWKDAESYWWV